MGQRPEIIDYLPFKGISSIILLNAIHKMANFQQVQGAVPLHYEISIRFRIFIDKYLVKDMEIKYKVPETLLN
jgi:hypothetical protein